MYLFHNFPEGIAIALRSPSSSDMPLRATCSAPSLRRSWVSSSLQQAPDDLHHHGGDHSELLCRDRSQNPLFLVFPARRNCVRRAPRHELTRIRPACRACLHLRNRPARPSGTETAPLLRPGAYPPDLHPAKKPDKSGASGCFDKRVQVRAFPEQSKGCHYLNPE